MFFDENKIQQEVSDFEYVMPEKLLYVRAEWTFYQCRSKVHILYVEWPLQTIRMYKL